MTLSEFKGYEQFKDLLSELQINSFPVVEELRFFRVKDLTHSVSLKLSGNKGTIHFKFQNVQDFRFNHVAQVMGFAVDEVREKQLDGINYEVYDYEDNVLQFCAKQAEIVAFMPTAL